MFSRGKEGCRAGVDGCCTCAGTGTGSMSCSGIEVVAASGAVFADISAILDAISAICVASVSS